MITSYFHLYAFYYYVWEMLVIEIQHFRFRFCCEKSCVFWAFHWISLLILLFWVSFGQVLLSPSFSCRNFRKLCSSCTRKEMFFLYYFILFVKMIICNTTLLFSVLAQLLLLIIIIISLLYGWYWSPDRAQQ